MSASSGATRPTASRGPAATLLGSWPVLLLRAAHPWQALVTAAVLGGAAAASGRAGRECALVAATVLVGQALIGWHNDLTDRERDAGRPGKPVASGELDPGMAWFAVACAVLLVVPLALGNGVTAGASYLLSVLAALVGNLVLRRTPLSWLAWAVSYGLLPAFLSYGGWGGQATGDPPTVVVTVLAALAGVTVHFLLALPDLVGDNEQGMRHLPLRVALRTGAPRLLWICVVVAVFLGGSLVMAGATVGLRQ